MTDRAMRSGASASVTKAAHSYGVISPSSPNSSNSG